MAGRRIDRDHLHISCWTFCVVIVLGLAGLLAWLSLTPKKPRFKIYDAHFLPPDSNNLSSTHANVSITNSSVIFVLEIYNPNKRMGIYFMSGIIAELHEDGRGAVGTNSTPIFYQRPKDITLFRISIRAGREVRFVIRVKTSVRYRIMKWKTKLHDLSYEKRFDKVQIGHSGTVSDGNFTERQNASKVEVRS